MTAREKIFSRLGKAEESVKSFRYNLPLQSFANSVSAFVETATKAGSLCYQITSTNEINEWISKNSTEGDLVFSKIASINGNIVAAFETEYDFLFIRATAGIAENGSVWIDDQIISDRKLLFLCKHLVILLDERDIVADMALAGLRKRMSATGYGVLISGPSKTADIEQSLVIGAQGPLTCHVFILSEKR